MHKAIRIEIDTIEQESTYSYLGSARFRDVIQIKTGYKVCGYIYHCRVLRSRDRKIWKLQVGSFMRHSERMESLCVCK